VIALDTAIPLQLSASTRCKEKEPDTSVDSCFATGRY
jgi:hypothetical protein